MRPTKPLLRLSLVRSGIDTLEDSPIIDVWRMALGVPDVIGMWAGEADIPTPKFICDAAAKALADGHTFYSQNRGIDALRAALVAYHQRIWDVDIPESRLALTSSGMNSVMLVAQALIGHGDNIVAVTPSWPNICRAMQLNGASIREVPMCRGNSGWSLDLDAVFAACDSQTRLIYLASPGNPTGFVLERAEGERLLAFARERNIAILSDEVYHRIVYDRQVAFSMLEIAGPDDPVFVIGSFSKTWAMTGWRLGWLVFPDGMATAFEKLIQFNTSGAQAFLQYGAIAALKYGDAFAGGFVARCAAGRDIINERLGHMPRIRNIPSEGSFYAMFGVAGVQDTLTLCKRAVVEAGVGMAPGEAFGAGAESLVRLCYAKSPETLVEAMDRLERFVDGYVEA